MTQSIKEQQKRVTKTLKSLHDLLKQQKKISTRAEFLRFVDKAISENSLVRDFLLRGGRMGVFEADLKEIFDSKKSPYIKDAGKEKARTDIIHAKEQRDNIYMDSKFSNTVGQTTMYMTQYFSPGICSDLFHGYVRLSMPIECDGAGSDAPDDSELAITLPENAIDQGSDPATDGEPVGAKRVTWPSECKQLNVSDGIGMVQFEEDERPNFCFDYYASAGNENISFNPQLDKKGVVDHVLIKFDLDWLKKNKRPTLYVLNLHFNKIWIEWPAWRNQPGVDKNVWEQNMKDLKGVKVLIRAYTKNPNYSTVAKTAEYGRGHKQYWKHCFAC